MYQYLRKSSVASDICVQLEFFLQLLVSDSFTSQVVQTASKMFLPVRFAQIFDGDCMHGRGTAETIVDSWLRESSLHKPHRKASEKCL